MNSSYPYLPVLRNKMADHGLAPVVIDTFAHYYKELVDGATGVIPDDTIRPLTTDEVVFAEDLAGYAEAGRKIRARAVRITLNGGLGTSMGLTGPKSLLNVKNGRTFLDVILAQSQSDGVRQAFMNSFNTDRETRKAVEKANLAETPLMFVQNKFPKILKDNYAPAEWPGDPQKEWNPPGHGDIYTAIYATGILDGLLDKDIRYAFIHNSDNLGATLDESLLGYFAETGIPFMMEAARRNPVDFKGGHLAARLSDGRLILRESAQCPPGTRGTDVSYYQYFNTNNLWIDLHYLKRLIKEENTIRLPMIVNPKNLDPRKPDSPKVFQVETAMGAAIELFEGAGAVIVLRKRFFPVKKCNDLMVIRSDRYRFTPHHRLEADGNSDETPPCIDLDPDYFGRIDQFDKRFPHGVPSLKECERLTVRGDIRFGADVRIKGAVTLTNRGEAQQAITAGTVIDRDREY